MLSVVAFDDPARPERRAASWAARLVEGTAARLDVVALAPYGDRRPADLVAGREDAVVVIDVHGGGFLGDVLFDEDAEDVLQHSDLPVVAIGPAARVPPTVGTLLLAADQHTPLEVPLDLAARWAASFGPARVALTILGPPPTWPDASADDLEPARMALGQRGLDGAVQRLPTLEPADAIAAAVTTTTGALAVVTTRRRPAADHWFSTARTLIRRAATPIVVVPY